MEEGSGGSGSGSGNAAGSSGGGSSNSGDSGSNTEEPRARCAEGVAGDNPVTEEACVDTTGDSQPGAADIGSSSLVTDADTDAPEPMDEAVLQQIRDKFLLSQQVKVGKGYCTSHRRYYSCRKSLFSFPPPSFFLPFKKMRKGEEEEGQN